MNRRARNAAIIADYLQALLATGLRGHNLEEVAHRLVCEGIERAIADGLIPRRHTDVTYRRLEKK